MSVLQIALDEGHVHIHENLDGQESPPATRLGGRRREEYDGAQNGRRRSQILRVSREDVEREPGAPWDVIAELAAVVDTNLADRPVDGDVEELPEHCIFDEA